MSIQQFCLRWNNHQPNFISVFTNLLNSESLVDVTLAAEGRHLQAHKVVLSACSTYFQTLFSVNPCQHPIVILKDVKYSDLKTMVDFMYYGEVNVSQEQLPAILKTAEMLKIKGLAEMPEQNIAGSVQMSKSLSISSDKAELLTSTESTWGPDSHSSPAPLSPSMRRKRLRKSSTGSGSGSTERTSEELPSEITLVTSPALVKPEPIPATPEGESGRSEGSLRNSTQEPSTDSEPRDGSQDSVEDDQLTLQISQDSSAGEVEPPVADTGPSTSQQPVPSQNYAPSFRQTGSRSVLTSVSQRKKQIFTLRKGTTQNFLQAIEDVRSGKCSFLAAGKKYGVSHMTLYRYYLSMGYPVSSRSNHYADACYKYMTYQYQ